MYWRLRLQWCWYVNGSDSKQFSVLIEIKSVPGFGLKESSLHTSEEFFKIALGYIQFYHQENNEQCKRNNWMYFDSIRNNYANCFM